MPFPKFEDGDVDIKLSLNDESHCYRLHSLVLALHSPFFKASLSDKWNTDQKNSSSASQKSWAYELRFPKGTADGILVRKAEEDSSSELIDLNTEKSHRKVQIVHAHEKFLALFYHNSLGWNMDSFYIRMDQIEELLDVADMYDGVQLVKNPLEKELLYGQVSVLHICAFEPNLILSLAIRLKCEWLYKEAATHLLGRSDCAFNEELMKNFESRELNEETRVVLSRQRKDFINELKDAEHKLMIIVPENNDKWSLTAVGFFRQALAKRIAKSRDGSGLRPGYAKLYHDIAKMTISSASVPSTRVEMITHLRLLGFGASEENLRLFDEALAPILLQAASILKRKILVNNARKPIDVADAHRALTFCSPRDNEYPWSLAEEKFCRAVYILSEDENESGSEGGSET